MYKMINDVLVISLATICSGIIVLGLRLCFKSKCSDVDLCCGLFKIKRNIELEMQIENKELESHDKTKSNKDLNNVV